MWVLPLVVKLAYKSEPLNRGDRHGVKGLEVVKVVKDRPRLPMWAKHRASTRVGLPLLSVALIDEAWGNVVMSPSHRASKRSASEGAGARRRPLRGTMETAASERLATLS